MSISHNDYNRYLGPMFTDTQTAALELLPYATAPFSAIGSCLIIRFIWWKRETALKILFHRIMLCISVLDLLTSLGVIVLGPWAVPSEVEFTIFGRGTYRTCSVSGFFLNFVFGTMWYSSFLSLYFLLVVYFEWKEASISCCLEPIAHLLGLLGPLVLGIYGVVEGAMNPMRMLPGFCWFYDYPPYCSTMENTPDCIRGETYTDLSRNSSSGLVMVLLCIIIASMALIVSKVHRTEGRLRRYSIGDSGGELSRTKETAQQAVLYIASFFAIYSPIMFLGIVGDSTKNPDDNTGAVFAFALLTKAFTPMQGVFNAYIYLHKTFWKLTHEEECFGFLRKIPLLGRWVCKLSDHYGGSNSGNLTAATTTGSDGRDNSTLATPQLSITAEKTELPQKRQLGEDQTLELSELPEASEVQMIRFVDEDEESLPVVSTHGAFCDTSSCVKS